MNADISVCIVGSGYVGLPLAMAFAEKYDTINYSHSPNHIDDLKNGIDRTENFTSDELAQSSLAFTSDVEDIKKANIYIITVPTPIDENNIPDLEPIKSATQTIAKVLKKGDIVVYESTVFIGCTEELCVPILEKSGLVYNEAFFCGYSPERINPADKERTLSNIKKIVSGSTQEVTDRLVSLYGTIIDAGIHRAPSMRVAEASKLIENVQRDVNIALINQLSILFDSFGIDTNDVLEAASTKWNFHRYAPGLVGGHCISVDPYYLIKNGGDHGIDMSLVKDARKTNDYMSKFVALKMLSLLDEKSIIASDASVLIMGFSFKEDCPDIRNTKVADIYHYLKKNVKCVEIYDPVVDTDEIAQTYALECLGSRDQLHPPYDGIIVAVGHDRFKHIDIRSLCKSKNIVYDLKGILDISQSDARL